MAETKRTFEQDDLFNRKPYAKFLEKLILNSGSYHRDDDVQAYTIAIDSPWGTGKSVFLEKFENMLEEDYPDQIRIVHYSAWKNDFWDNAFEPLADAIFTSEWFCNALQDDTNEQSAKKFLGAAKNVMLSFVKKELENHCDAELLEKAIEDFAKGLKFATTKNISFLSKSYLDYVASLKQMQDAMDEVLLKTLPGGKLVIIIDELDRCRPTFAIETLEIVKHIMDVKDVVYIFSLDVRQLGAAIKQVYGADTDATGYLMRFFSYYSRMPVAKNRNIIEKMAANEFSEILENESMVQEIYPNIFLDYMTAISDILHLSARDLETVGKVYVYMGRMFLASYRNSQAFLLYWFLLCAKYKDPVLFDKWINDPRNKTLSPVHEQIMKELPPWITSAIQKINDPLPIEKMQFVIREKSFHKMEQMTEYRLVLEEKKNGEIQVYGYSAIDATVRRKYNFTEDSDLSGVLFFQDLLRWKNITGITLKEYFAGQLEMFNFIPEIPSATE